MSDDERDDDDRPARRSRRRRDDDTESAGEPHAAVTVLGALSLIFGIMSFIGSLVPCIGIIAAGFAIIPLALGIIGIVLAKLNNSRGLGLPITGSVLSVLAIVVALVWYLIVAGFMQGVQKTAENVGEANRQAREREQEAVQAGPAVRVTAIELHAAYDGNAINADTKYRGKVLEVKGTVVRVDDRRFDLVVELEGIEDDRDTTVDCEFRTDKRAALGRLMPKQTVTIRGRCVGMRADTVRLEDCVLVP